MDMVKIDPLYLLLLIELTFILFMLIVYLFSRNRKHKELYQNALKKLNDHVNHEQEQQPLQDPAPEEFPEPPDPGDKEWSALPDLVRRLQRMVNSQKNTILGLMCYKDVFEGTRKRLAVLQHDNKELQDKIRDLIKGGAKGSGFEEAVAALEESDLDLEKYITVIDREDERLTEKFQVWEEEFKHISEDVEMSSDSAASDAVKYSWILQEKETLTASNKELQEKLEEKDKKLEEIQVGYADLEREYMILYRRHAPKPQG
ncbi:MAG TPA: hypothetical protein VJW95_08055 [Dissulfurispiraceae bacterium]|nr:hypothetical protein [Dissulfurispiraceae bacterium]